MDPPTPYVRFTPESEPTARTVLIHGLNSNKEFMQTFAMALADAGVDTYAIDLPGHGDSPATFNYTDSLVAVERFLDAIGGDGEPVVVGHSMGAALLLELAPFRRFETMLLLSPAPVPVEPFPGERLLVVSGGLEAPRIRRFVPEILEAAGGESEWWQFPYAAHSSALFDPDAIVRMTAWINERPADARTIERYGWLILMTLAGIGAGAAILWKKAGIAAKTSPPPPAKHILVGYVASSGAAVLLLGFLNPMGWLDAFAGDYLIGLILIVGILLWRGRRFAAPLRSVILAATIAAYVIAILLVGVAAYLVHLIPSGIQWLWFPVLTIAGLPLFLYDAESLLSLPSPWLRWGTFLLTRAILWAATITGVLLVSTDAAFLVLIMHFVVIFWVLLGLATDFVKHVTGEPTAAALFAALIQAWVFASLTVRV